MLHGLAALLDDELQFLLARPLVSHIRERVLGHGFPHTCF